MPIQQGPGSSPPPHNQPPQSGQPGQYDSDDSVNDVENNATNDDTQKTNTTSVVDETQFVEVEIDTQAPEDQFSHTSDRSFSQENGQLQEVPGAIPEPVFQPTNQGSPHQQIPRPEVWSINDINAGFRFAAAPRPQSRNSTESRPLQAASSMPSGPPRGVLNSHPSGDKLTEEARPAIPSRGGRSRSSVNVPVDNSHVSQNNPLPVTQQPGTRAPVVENPMQERISSQKTSRQQNTPAPVGSHVGVEPHMGASMTQTRNEHAIPQGGPNSQVRAPGMPQMQQPPSHSMPNPHMNDRQIKEGSNNNNNNNNNNNKRKLTKPPFPDVMSEMNRPPVIRNLPARGLQNQDLKGLDRGHQKHGIRDGSQAPLPYPHGQHPHGSLEVNKHQEVQLQERNIVSHENPGGQVIQHGQAAWHEQPQGNRHQASLHEPSNHNHGSHPRGVQMNELELLHHQQQVRQSSAKQMQGPDVMQQQQVRQASAKQIGRPDVLQQQQVRQASAKQMQVPDVMPQHQQIRQPSGKQMIGRPMPAPQLEPQSTPHHAMEKSRGITKSSRSKPPKPLASGTSDRNTGQPGPMNAKPTSLEMMQMVMFMAHGEKEQSQATELQLQDQQAKLEQLVNENFALHQHIGSLQEEKYRLDVEFVKLRGKSEQYKTHMNDVTRSQKHLQGLMQESDAKKTELLKEVQEREDAARKQVEEARAEVEAFRNSFVPRVDEGVKDARHEIEKLRLAYDHIEKDLDGKALELLRERGRCDSLQKKVDEHQPDREALFQKLGEHFEKVNQQLSGQEGKLSSMASAEETANSKADECLTILNALKDKETPEPLALGELVKMVENLATRVENRFTSDGETRSNLREAGNKLLDDLKDRVEAIRTDQKAQEALTERIATLREKNAGLTEKIQAMEGELTELKNQHLNLKGEYSATKEELDRVLALTREDPLLQSQVQQLQNTNASLTNQIDTISKEVASTKEQLVVQQNKSKSEQEQADMLRSKLQDAESLVSGFNAQKSKYEHMKTEESKELRKGLEQTLSEKLAEQTLQHQQDEMSLKRAKTKAEKKLSTAQADLEKAKQDQITAEKKLSTALADLDKAKQDESNLKSAKQDKITAEKKLSTALADLEKAKQGESTLKSAKQDKITAEKKLSTALAELEKAKQDESALKSAKTTAEKALRTALADLEKAKASCLTAENDTDELRNDLDAAETENEEQAAEIGQLGERLDSATEQYSAISNELQSARDEISQCRQLAVKGENQAAKSTELLEKARDEALQGVKNAEEHAETEIGKLKEQIVKMQEKLSEAKKIKEAVHRHLDSRRALKTGQTLEQWADQQDSEPQETRAEESTPRPAPRVSFQTAPSVQTISNAVQSSALRNPVQPQTPSSRGRPRIADRKASVQSHNVINPSHMTELDNMLMQRTEITEFSVRTSKTYESHRNTPSQGPNAVAESTHTPSKFMGSTEINSSQRLRASSPISDLGHMFPENSSLETVQGMGSALRQRSTKASQKNSAEQDTTRIQNKGADSGVSNAEESARRRTQQVPKSAMKRSHSTSNPQSSIAASESEVDEGLTPSTARQDQIKAPAGVLLSRSTNTAPGFGRQSQHAHGFGGSPYNRVVSGNGSSKQKQNTTGEGYRNSSLSQELPLTDGGEQHMNSRKTRRNTSGVVTRSAGNGDDHPAKLQRVSQAGRRAPSRTLVAQNQTDSQFSAYAPSQEL